MTTLIAVMMMVKETLLVSSFFWYKMDSICVMTMLPSVAVSMLFNAELRIGRTSICTTSAKIMSMDPAYSCRKGS